MIQIQEHLNKPNPKAFLKKLALDHWEYLNPKKNDGTYFYYSLISICNRYFSESLTNSYKVKYAKNNAALAAKHKTFFEFLIDSDYYWLKRIIISPPSGYGKIRSEIFKILRTSDLFILKNGRLVQTPFGKLLTETIFDYNKFRRSSYCTELFDKLELSSAYCPYCNDNKISIVTITNELTSIEKKRAYFEVDHFLSKAENPIFAVSFYNLVPACHSCNSPDKSDKSFTNTKHIHPYLRSFDDYFDFKLNQLMAGKPGDKIILNSLSGKKYKSFIRDLNLENRYQSNLDQANRLADLYFKYKNKIGTPQENMFIDMMLNEVPTERYKIIRYDKGKMKRDILRHLDSANKVLGL